MAHHLRPQIGSLAGSWVSGRWLNLHWSPLLPDSILHSEHPVHHLFLLPIRRSHPFPHHAPAHCPHPPRANGPDSLVTKHCPQSACGCFDEPASYLASRDELASFTSWDACCPSKDCVPRGLPAQSFPSTSIVSSIGTRLCLTCWLCRDRWLARRIFVHLPPFGHQMTR